MKKPIELIVLVILFASLIFSLIYTSLTDYVVGLKFYIGLGGTILALLIRYRFLKLGSLLLGLILLAGTFNLIEYSHISYSISIFGIAFNPFVLILFLFFLIDNRDEINNLLGSDELSDSDKQNILDKEVDSYKTQFAQKTKSELKEIVDNPDGYTAAAILASKKLLEDN